MKKIMSKSQGRIIMQMRSRILSEITFALILLSVSTASASYAGDKPLDTVFHDKVEGRIFFSLGDSRYSGVINYNETYAVNFDVVMPENAIVKLARLYIYWVWSKDGNMGVYPTMEAMGTNGLLTEAVNYTDNKGFAGLYDFFSGVNVYDVTSDVGENYRVVTRNADANGSTFVIQGIGLLVIYECQECPIVEYWVNEGADMLYADYGITPGMATSKIHFDGDIELKNIRKASLITAVPSAGYTASGETAHNRLYFNEEVNGPGSFSFLKKILKLVFGYESGIWNDVYFSNDIMQIGVDERDVTKYMKPSNNFAAVQDNHDYMTLTNAVLYIEEVT
jgi:hypothetical protein